MGARVLYDQNSDGSGITIFSEAYSSATYSRYYNDQGADDFVIPKGQRWTITEVDITANGPFTENVFFYRDNHGVPGAAVKKGTFYNVLGTYSQGGYAIGLPRPVRLGPGHYWLSVQLNCGSASSCDFGTWELTTVTHNDPAVWEQPGNGFGLNCQSWRTLSDCFGYQGDLMFALKGKLKREPARGRN
jgi:hypothetical protein